MPVTFTTFGGLFLIALLVIVGGVNAVKHWMGKRHHHSH